MRTEDLDVAYDALITPSVMADPLGSRRFISPMRRGILTVIDRGSTIGPLRLGSRNGSPTGALTG